MGANTRPQTSRPPASLKAPAALDVEPVPINSHCSGERWIVADADHLAKLVAIVAMGQAVHAADIIQQLETASPAISHAELFKAARRQLRVIGKTIEQMNSSRWHRDGFVFEVISWVAARQSSGLRTFLKDPHLKSTTQGIDGLMVEMDLAKPEVKRATVFEDKCSDHPRKMFRDEVMETFHDHHQNKRGPELVATAAALIEKSGLSGKNSVTAASRVLDLAYRRYRAALTVAPTDDTNTRRKAIFKDYEELDNIDQQQRIGATLVVDGDLRDYFDQLSHRAISLLDEWEAEKT